MRAQKLLMCPTEMFARRRVSPPSLYESKFALRRFNSSVQERKDETFPWSVFRWCEDSTLEKFQAISGNTGTGTSCVSTATGLACVSDLGGAREKSSGVATRVCDPRGPGLA